MPRPRPPVHQGDSEGRTAWHVLLAHLLKQRAPRSFRVLSEVPLGKQPPRLDLLLLRRQRAGDRGARVLRSLWHRIVRVAVLEYKSPAESIRTGDLAKLLAYAMLYAAEHPEEMGGAHEGLLVGLVVPSVTPTLRSELSRFRWSMDEAADGYHTVRGAFISMLVVVLDKVSEAEHDGLLSLLGHGTVQGVESRKWWREQVGGPMPKISELPGYDQLVQRLFEVIDPKDFIANIPPKELLAGLKPEQRLAGLKPEQRLAGLKPEQRLAGLKPEQRLAGLKPEQRLAGLKPEQRLAGLKPEQRLAGLKPEQRLALLSEVLRATLPGELSEGTRKDLERLMAPKKARKASPPAKASKAKSARARPGSSKASGRAAASGGKHR